MQRSHQMKDDIIFMLRQYNDISNQGKQHDIAQMYVLMFIIT